MPENRLASDDPEEETVEVKLSLTEFLTFTGLAAAATIRRRARWSR